MTLKFYNTLSRTKEEFIPIQTGKVGMYTCGPTVYDFAHLGNFRAYVVADLIKRYLKYKGYEVRHIVNLTDVDDNTIRGSQKEKIPLSQYTQRYKDAFFEDVKALNIQLADLYPEATVHVKDMVKLVEILLEKGHAYMMDNSIYFKIPSYQEYGKLSHMNLKGLKLGARVSADQYDKEEVADFALWKGWDEKDGDVFWETEIGKGRPGWHVECSVMSMKYLGKHFDVHTGGVDLVFPHHENEIAQSQAATGEKFVNFWLHNEFLMVEGRRMAKSLGNYYTLRDVLNKGYPSKAVRYLLLSTHYRQQLNFTFKGLEGAKGALQRLFDFMDKLESINGEKDNPAVQELLSKVRTKFEENLDDDLNISGALGETFDFVREINTFMDDGSISKNNAKMILDQMWEFDKVLGVLEKEELILSEEIKELIQKREDAREKKDWTLADKIRSEIESKGITVEDTSEGPKVKKKI